jgi:ribonuclease BN (tRNA processing enzyme)
MTQITFLGTGGGRFATIYQTRSTGGIYIQDKLRMIIDPGPGAILRMNQNDIDPTTIELLMISHCHPDHYTDADIMVEAMTMGGTQKRGTILGSQSVISGIDGFNQKVSDYHLSRLEKVHSAGPNMDLLIDDVKIQTIPTIHTDPSGIGFKIHSQHGIITYTGDTSISDEVIDSYKDSRILIMALTTPIGVKLNHHLSPEDAVTVLQKVKPEKALLTHFGLRAIKEGPQAIAQWIEEQSGVKTVAADDGIKFAVEEEIEIDKN